MVDAAKRKERRMLLTPRTFRGDECLRFSEDTHPADCFLGIEVKDLYTGSVINILAGPQTKYESDPECDHPRCAKITIRPEDSITLNVEEAEWVLNRLAAAIESINVSRRLKSG